YDCPHTQSTPCWIRIGEGTHTSIPDNLMSCGSPSSNCVSGAVNSRTGHNFHEYLSIQQKYLVICSFNCLCLQSQSLLYWYSLKFKAIHIYSVIYTFV
uniref:Uncharacterized protein n=1 Tax=Sparus aurata TaxID=8175 RepID=A0A671W121_SPAAU